MNDLFEEMKNDYEIFCRSAQRFMDAVKEQNTPTAVIRIKSDCAVQYPVKDGKFCGGLVLRQYYTSR